MRLTRKLLSQPILVKLIALPCSWLLRLWLGTLEFRFLARSAVCNPAWSDRPALYVFWHEMLLFPAYTHARFNVATLISHHRDGELLAQILRMLRGKAVRGSTRRRSVPALRKLIHQGRISHLAIAPDGPRGPRRVVQPGAIFLASRTGMPLVPAGLAFGKCRRVKSWDRMALPRPWQAARAVIGEPIDVPDNLSRDQIEQYRLKLQSALDDLQAQAERLAAEAKSDQNLLTLSQVQSRQSALPARTRRATCHS